MKKYMVILGIAILACLGASFWCYQAESADRAMLEEKGYLNYQNVAFAQLEDGLHVGGVVSEVFACYAEEYEADYGVFRTSDDSEALYYLIPVYRWEQERAVGVDYFIGLRSEPEHFDELEKIFEQTMSGNISGPAASCDIGHARIQRASQEIYGYLEKWYTTEQFYENGTFLDWCVEYNLFHTSDPQQVGQRIVPYVINCDVEEGGAGNWIVFLWLAGFCAIGLVIVIICHMRRRRAGFQG